MGFGDLGTCVWGRQGGKVLVLAPSIPVAICVIRGAAHLHGLTFDTPLGRPASEGSDTGTTQGMPVLGLSHEGLIDADQSGYATGLTGAAFRGWIKEKLLNAIQELSLGMVLCIPPAILNHQDNLAVLHEAFAQEGPPPHWYSEREAKECEDAIAALPSEARLLAYLALEDEEGETPATLDVFWAEVSVFMPFQTELHKLSYARCRKQRPMIIIIIPIPDQDLLWPVYGFYLGYFLSSIPPNGRATHVTTQRRCLQCSGKDVQLHFHPVAAVAAVAAVQETWQPASPFKADLEQATLAEAAAELVRVAHFVAKEPPAGMAPRFIRSTQVPGLGVLDPTLPAHSSAWNGEAVQSGLLPALGGLGDVGEILSLAQGLCRFKGQELARQYTRHKDAHNLLEDLQKSAASSNASKLQQQLAEITRRFNEAQEEYEEKKAEHAESQKEFTELLDEVVNRCTQKANAVEAAEELVTKAKSEVESGRFQLLNFSKQDGVELRKAVHQHCTNDESGSLSGGIEMIEQDPPRRTPILALMELCCMLMRVSSTPTRDEVRTTLSEPNFATKMAATCAVDAETFSEAFVQPMKEAAAVADGMDTMDVKALSVLANVALPACQYTVTVLQLPKLREELRDLEEQREQRRPEVEDMELQTRLLFEDAELRKAT
ncbi:unnamed protein product [Cladocopium goreaui]|uniref:Ubiquitin-like domain-containing protein n=1 Tax=Cladocopium goreaui TaxID=2562237 RepID=A0A9P1GLC8_9DINO|nr:unnamed protein product [Cladocopium goreaui]